MKPDVHANFRTMIDEACAANAATPQAALLHAHLQSCDACRQYRDTNARVIGALGGYSFAVDLSHNASVFYALQQRAAQLHSKPAHPFNRKQFAWVCVLAVLFTATGLLVDLRFGTVLASLLPLHSAQAKQGMHALWLLGSFGSLLVFPLLPFLSRPLPSPSTLSPP